MGTFSASHVIPAVLSDIMSSKSFELGSDTIKVALFNDTPDQTVFPDDTLAHNAYGAAGGQWITGNEVTGTNWTAGGYAPGSPTLSFAATSSGALMNFTISNVSETSVTISTSFYGCIVYDSSVSSYVLCAVAFGGAYTVGGGTLAINWGNNNASTPAASVFYIDC